MTKEHKVLVGLGVVLVAGVVLVDMYNRQTAKAAANNNSTNFIGRTPYYNASGNIKHKATPSHPYGVSVAAGK